MLSLFSRNVIKRSYCTSTQSIIPTNIPINNNNKNHNNTKQTNLQFNNSFILNETTIKKINKNKENEEYNNKLEDNKNNNDLSINFNESIIQTLSPIPSPIINQNEKQQQHHNQENGFKSKERSFKNLKYLISNPSIKNKLRGENEEKFIKFIQNKLALLDPYLLNKLNQPGFNKQEELEEANEFVRGCINLYLKSLKQVHKKASEVLADLKEPHLWYPEARAIKRKIILHVGPTNSGKTHHALDRLMKAESGVYCGPLRLLAQEVYEKLQKNGVEASMLTGQIRIVNPNAKHISCTVELANTQEMVEVAVIDEFQLIADSDRGSAWTRAILGVPALEIHLCGDGSSKELIRKLCEITGDSYELREYKRLSPLEIQDDIARMRNLKKGDCLVTFSKKSCIALKEKMEKSGKKCAIIYGTLPPIVRLQQAKRFNETNDADILIATDCIGMGLNLNIARIIFTSVEKFDGKKMRLLKGPEIRQIGGRAGRFSSDFKGVGQVTSFDYRNLKYIRKSFESKEEVNRRAGLFPPADQLELYGQNFATPKTPFSNILKDFVMASNLDDHYFLCYFERFLEIAEKLDTIQMSIPDKYIFVTAPFQINSNLGMQHLKKYAYEHSLGNQVPFTLGKSDIQTKDTNYETLQSLEELFYITDGYLWLSNEFPHVFTERENAQTFSEYLTKLISDKIKTLSFNKLKMLD